MCVNSYHTSFRFCQNWVITSIAWHHTAMTKYQNFETNIPRKRISGSQSQFPHSCVWEWFIYSHDVCLFCWRKYVDRSWDYINRSQTHKCGNWGWGPAISRKGILKWDFRCSASLQKSSVSDQHWFKCESIFRSCRGILRDDLRGLRICYAASLQYTALTRFTHIVR
jgi:hypothetical protein